MAGPDSVGDSPAPARAPTPVWDRYADRLSRALLIPRPSVVEETEVDGLGTEGPETEGSETPPPSIYPEYPPTPRLPERRVGSRRSAAVLGLAAVGIGQAYFALLPSLGSLGSDAAYVVLPLLLLGLLGLFLYLQRAKFSDIGFRTPGNAFVLILTGVSLAGLFVFLQVEPAFVLGFQKSPLPYVSAFALVALSAPLVAAAQEGVFRGYVLRTFAAGGNFPRALYVSSALFALSVTSLPLLPNLGVDLAIQYLFTTTLVSFVLGLVAGSLFYKSSWTLWGVIAFRSIQIVQTQLFSTFTDRGGWSVPFVFALVGYGAVLVVLTLVMRDPRARARRFLGDAIGPRTGRFRERSRLRQEVVTTLLVVGVLAGILGGGYVLVTEQTGVHQPLLAIPTGSMIPTINPGDMVVLKPAPPAPVAVGTIVAYSTTCLPSPVVHRVVAEHLGKAGTWVYTTKGDNNPSKDACPVPAAAVLGVVALIVPYAGYFILTPELGVALVLGAVAASYLIPRRKFRARPRGT